MDHQPQNHELLLNLGFDGILHFVHPPLTGSLFCGWGSNSIPLDSGQIRQTQTPLMCSCGSSNQRVSFISSSYLPIKLHNKKEEKKVRRVGVAVELEWVMKSLNLSKTLLIRGFSSSSPPSSKGIIVTHTISDVRDFCRLRCVRVSGGMADKAHEIDREEESIGKKKGEEEEEKGKDSSRTPPPPPLPTPPEKPLPGDCCGSGCVRCVWDIYYEELEDYNNLLQTHSPSNKS